MWGWPCGAFCILSLLFLISWHLLPMYLPHIHLPPQLQSGVQIIADMVSKKQKRISWRRLFPS